MKQTKIIMGMPITVEIVGAQESAPFTKVFSYFRQIDRRFSPYKEQSELSKYNHSKVKTKLSPDMEEVLALCAQTKELSGGYFDITRSDGTIDTSGLVKGWAIDNAAKMLKSEGFSNFYVEAGGDIQAEGFNDQDEPWAIGIRNPFKQEEIVKAIKLSGMGVATSGTYIRGEHIYDPLNNYQSPKNVASLTVIGPNIFEADRFATAAFAMGEKGVSFIASLPGFEAYQINNVGRATFTQGFNSYVV